jgi:hypothetical protein
MIGRKNKGFARDDRREAVSPHAKSGEALRETGLASQCANKRAAREDATRYPIPIVHRRKS